MAAGLTGAFGDEVFHGIFGGGTGPSGGRRAGAGARALHGGIGFRCPLCGGAAPGSRAAVRTRPHYGPGPRYGYGPGPSLLPSTEVYSVLRDNGFSPLGIPRLRGFVYTIAVIDRGGEDGRLIIDARNGRIIRFVPAYRMGGDNVYEEQSALRGPSVAQPPQAQAPDHVQAAPRPSRPAHVASRTVPMPKASPIAAKPAPAPVQQAAAPAPKSAEVQAARPGDNRRGSSQARPADCTDPGHAHDAGAGVNSRRPAKRTTTKKRPGFPGAFSLRRAIRAGLRRPGSGRRPCPAARPATGGRRPVRPSSRSCAWPETARGRD